MLKCTTPYWIPRSRPRDGKMSLMHVSRKSKFKNVASTDLSHPFRRAVIVVENKLKYLEQRKKRIESYQEAQKNGKKLTSFQLSALSKLGQVTRILEDVRDVHDQFCNISQKVAVVQERQEEKDVPDRTQKDLANIRDVLMIQYVLQNMRQDNVREDFLTGQNGAICLSENDLECLDEFYVEISLMNGMDEDVPPFEDQLQQSAEHLLALVNGSSKEINGTTYAKLKDLIVAIQSCGYFDYIVEDPAPQMILQQNPKDETEMFVEDFIMPKEDIEEDYDDDVLQQPVDHSKGTSTNDTRIDVAKVSEPFREQSNNHLSERKFMCTICQRKFSRKDHLTRHVPIHSRKPVCCTICESTFTRERDLKLHMRIHAGTSTSCTSTDAAKNSEPFCEQFYYHPSEKMFVCKICQRKFSRKHHVTRHLVIHSRKPACCTICELKFTQERALKAHMRIHAGTSTSCTSFAVAKFTEPFREQFNNHLSEKPFICKICQRKFSKKYHLARHLLIHFRKPACCTICESTFTRGCDLKTHMRIHAGEKKFSCEMCDAVFRRKDYLKRHVFNCHNDKEFACSCCKASFSRPSSLRSHMRTHTIDKKLFRCSVCDTSFSRNDELKTHMINHVEEEEFLCTVCSSTFAEKGQLDQHMLSHTNTTLICPVCRAKFYHKSQLGKHILLHL